MKILITGGEGFLAKNIQEHFENIYEIHSFSSSELNLLDFDQVEYKLKEGKYDIILHTANYDITSKISTKDPSKVVENNLKMFFNLFKCKDLYNKLINFGSGAEYGQTYWVPKMDETFFNNYILIDTYGFSKYVIANFIENYKNNFYNFRIFAIFGKYENYHNRFISNAICRSLFNLPIIIEQNIYFDYLHITDFLKIIDWGINNNPKKNSYNICRGKTYSLLYITSLISKISNKKLQIIIKNEGLNREYSGNNDLLLNEMGFINFKNFELAVEELFYWYKDNKHIININTL